MISTTESLVALKLQLAEATIIWWRNGDEDYHYHKMHDLLEKIEKMQPS